ncbi:MAG: DegT/DnrJ/EryC1/StrS family aminotransferase [Promethearchaeota archaeon]
MCPEGIPFYIPWITTQDKKAVSRALKSRWLTGGPLAAQFEKQFANYVGIKHAVSVNSCTAALHLAMRVLKIKSGDEVIVPDITFAATANAPLFVGATPIFADIDEKTFNISPKDLLNKITPKTKAVIPVHYAGQPCDMKELMEIAEDYKIHIVEDCAHSLGAEYKGEKTGSFGVFGCFSFYPTKIITTLEGGMITTNDENFAKKLRVLREHGMSKTALDRELGSELYYDVVDLGYNYRLTEVQSALGISQLKRVEEGIRRRIEAANYYEELLKLDGMVLPYKAFDRSHVFHLYVIKVEKERFGVTRDELFEKLSDNGVGVSLHYTPLHQLSFYKKFLLTKMNKFPVAERVYNQILSLPLYPTITKKDIDFVAKNLVAASSMK